MAFKEGPRPSRAPSPAQQDPAVSELQQRVLQQRADRQDLRRLGQGPAAHFLGEKHAQVKDLGGEGPAGLDQGTAANDAGLDAVPRRPRESRQRAESPRRSRTGSRRRRSSPPRGPASPARLAGKVDSHDPATSTPRPPATAPAPAGRPGTGAGTERRRLARFDLKARRTSYIAPFFLLFGVFGLFPLAYTPGCRCTTGTARRRQDLRRPRQLHRAARRRGLLERGVQHARHLRPLDGPAAPARPVPRQRCSTSGCAAGRFFRMAMLLPNVTSVAAVAHRLRAALRARLRHDQLAARPGRRRPDRLAERASGPPGSRSPRWSTGAGPATTR